MLLSKLLSGVEFEFKGDKNNLEIDNLAFDTRKMQSNSLYFCLTGEQSDGHNFAQTAVKNGAKALVVEHFVDVDVPQIKVKDARAVMAKISENFYDNPAKKLKLIGITGTNGKTTTTYILHSILQHCGFNTGVVGTIGVVVGNKTYPTTMTTPDPIEFNKILALMVKNNITHVVMEVSAHAIALRKMAGITFDVGVLTNITQDHLDYFKTFSHYADTKLSFISPKYCRCGVVNLDDKLAYTLYSKYKNSAFICRGFGISNLKDIHPTSFELQSDGIIFSASLNNVLQNYHSKLIGKFNLSNLLGALAVAEVLGLSPQGVLAGINAIKPVPGRFNVCPLFNGANAVVDYAHTPDGLQKILTSAREVCKGKLICVFGCGGNRDRQKRPIMANISAKNADYTIITSDNPRFEEPEKIICEVEEGIKHTGAKYECVTDREQAIVRAVELSKPNDIVVIAGKGAEDYLDTKGQKLHYSDYEVLDKINKNNSEVRL